MRTQNLEHESRVLQQKIATDAKLARQALRAADREKDALKQRLVLAQVRAALHQCITLRGCTILGCRCRPTDASSWHLIVRIMLQSPWVCLRFPFFAIECWCS